MDNVLKHFKDICKLPHCSGEAGVLRDFLVAFLRSCGCVVSVDRAGNIHAQKGAAGVCLQAHYDMVCVGDFCAGVQVREEGGWLSAAGTSLGADNGIGVAMIMAAAQEFEHFEALLTADEEIGLIGANNCEFAVSAPRLLNLDSEDEHEVIIGCAASFDATVDFAAGAAGVGARARARSKKRLFIARARGFAGGHSGVDIAKGIKSAITETARWLHAADAELVAFCGGERANSISVNACAVFAADALPAVPSWLAVDEVANADAAGLCEVLPDEILRSLAGFKQGVHEVDLAAGFVLASANLAIVNVNSLALADDFAGVAEISRSMTAHGLSMREISSQPANSPRDSVANSAGIAIAKFAAAAANCPVPPNTALIMARAATSELLDALESYTKAIFGARHTADQSATTVHITDRDEPWEPAESAFSAAVLAALRTEVPEAKIAAIHAGLECGVFKARQSALECASIGPNICAPHSVHERCEIASVGRVWRVVKQILNHYEKEQK